jgi:hypothetical protein
MSVCHRAVRQRDDPSDIRRASHHRVRGKSSPGCYSANGGWGSRNVRGDAESVTVRGRRLRPTVKLFTNILENQKRLESRLFFEALLFTVLRRSAPASEYRNGARPS